MNSQNKSPYELEQHISELLNKGFDFKQIAETVSDIFRKIEVLSYDKQSIKIELKGKWKNVLIIDNKHEQDHTE